MLCSGSLVRCLAVRALSGKSLAWQECLQEPNPASPLVMVSSSMGKHAGWLMLVPQACMVCWTPPHLCWDGFLLHTADIRIRLQQRVPVWSTTLQCGCICVYSCRTIMHPECMHCRMAQGHLSVNGQQTVAHSQHILLAGVGVCKVATLPCFKS